MSTVVVEAGNSVNLTGSAQIGLVSSPVTLIGFYVNSTNAGTIAFASASSGGTTISGTITPAIGFHRFPACCPNGLYATIAGTALNVTLFYVPGQA